MPVLFGLNSRATSVMLKPPDGEVVLYVAEFAVWHLKHRVASASVPETIVFAVKLPDVGATQKPGFAVN